MNKYYIVENDNRTGPYDLLAMIRKIRNGGIKTETLVAADDETAPVPAYHVRELTEVFEEVYRAQQQSSHQNKFQEFSLKKSLSWGIKFIQLNQAATVYTGLFMLASLIAFLGLYWFGLIGTALFAILMHFLFSGYFFSILRLTRGQPIEPGMIVGKIKVHMKDILTASAIIGIFCVIALPLLALPKPYSAIFYFVTPFIALFTLTFYLFAPLVIMERGCNFWEAMEASRKKVMQAGLQNFSVIFSLVALNFFAMACMIFPLLFMLPISMSAASEIYDELFHS